ncbi:Secretory carrier-associated membrane protein 2 [Bagarius yarrelli]|uniref:Secretory carrier-associated membrane protein n=1 Tax=Bagarius yarrelli TaxID=175774 RepID=A0A556U0X5_BAGYA|nr:Secretory carrier-associated membrane protein 2 [Bagarius yarrelli]
MSGLDSNPFASPLEVNPFQDPSVTQVTNTARDEVIEEFNPFSSRNQDYGTTIPFSAGSQPAVLQPTLEPSPQNFEEEIPPEYQRVCKMMYYLWMYHCVTLFLNLLACLALFVESMQNGVDFGLSILWFVLFSPAAFACWYRPVYKAFRSDSSFSFFFFFFIFAFQVVVYIIQSVGIPNWGNSGWITSIAMIRTNLVAAVFMMMVAVFFTVNAVLAVVLLKMVHAKYRRTGASFVKAQQEFSEGVVTNRTFQTAAATAASSAARGAFQ